MVTLRANVALCALGLMLALQGCMGVSTQHMIDQQDHSGLAMHYSQEAKELREKATHWEFMAEFYEQHPEPEAKADAAQHAAHCRTIAQSYRKAADEADALAAEHRRQRPHGMIN
jgi:hypothetical protein